MNDLMGLSKTPLPAEFPLQCYNEGMRGGGKSKDQRGFTLAQLMVSTLIISALGMGMATYLKRNSVNMRDGDLSQEIMNAGEFVQKALSNDLSQVVFLNPSHTSNPAPSTSPAVTTAPSSLVFLGGITPIPGATKENLDAETSFGVTSQMTGGILSNFDDATRLVLYNFTTTQNCRLSAWHGSNNPSTTQEALWVDRYSADSSGNIYCNLSVGQLYILVQDFNTTSYSNLFQVTALGSDTASTKSGYNEAQISVSSSSNRFNQVGGLGNSGFSSSARIYPVEVVEWAASSNGGLYRRVINPNSTDLVGLQPWVMIQKDVEGVQFYPYTTSEQQRQMTFDATATNNGIEDIIGVSPLLSIKSTRPSSNMNRTYSNPLATSPVPDSYPRLESKFFVSMQNRY